MELTNGYIQRCFDNLKNNNRYYIIATDFLIHNLENKGYEAYLVGGCVRDALLFREPKDFDITTNATTDQIKEVFSNLEIIETGIKHGTVTVVVESFGEKIPFEITTYRIDGAYSDGRHPDEVEFTKNLKEDLARRDFTINAMAYSPKDGLIDYFNGFHDLHHDTIKCVGNPVERFEEDGLRIMRAMRFATTLGFKIDHNTAYGMRVCKSNLKNVSKERIKAELDKMVNMPYFSRVLIDFPDIITEVIPAMDGMMWCTSENSTVDLYHDVVSSLWNIDGYLSKESAYALLFRDLELGSPKCYPKLDSLVQITVETATSIMKDLKFDNKMIQSVSNIIRWSFYGCPMKHSDMRHIISKIGKADTKNLIDMMRVHSHVPLAYSWTVEECDLVNAMYDGIKDETVFNVKDLDISGDDMVKIGYKGVQIKEILDKLLYSYFADILPNEHDALYKAAKEYYDYSAKIPF